MASARAHPSSRGQVLPLLVPVVATVSLLILSSLRTPGGSVSHYLASGPVVWWVPASAHAGGTNGARWRTDLELHNAGATAASYTIELLRRDSENLFPDSRSFSLSPQQSVRYTDLLDSVFGFSGAAAVRITTPSSLLFVTSCTYNLIDVNPWNLPVGSSFGQFVPAFLDAQAISYGQEGRLIHLTQRDSTSLYGFRTNVGIVNATSSPLDVTIDLYRADGSYLGTRQGAETSLRAYEFRQLDQIFRPWGTVDDGYAIVRPITAGGRLFAFATAMDNHNSGDPIFIPPFVLTAASGPSPTPTPTPTGSPTPTRTATPTNTPTLTPTTSPAAKPDLFPYRPSGWETPLVIDYQKGSRSNNFLSVFYTSYVSWAVANDGPGNITGRIYYELRLDGVTFQRWYSEDGLDAGYYISLEDYEIDPHTIPAGSHTLTLIADPDALISETNEGDNSYSRTWQWTTTVFGTGEKPTGTARSPEPELRLLNVAPRSIPGFSKNKQLASGPAVWWVPASAHAGGTNGARWRTDLELHNAGATAASYTIELLRRDSENLSPDSRSFALSPQQSVRYTDLLDSVFGFSGAAAVRITTPSSLLFVTSCTYNLIDVNPWNLPVGSSFGQFVPAFPDVQAISYGQEGRLIHLTQRDSASLYGFRTNVGIVNATSSPLDVTIDLYRADGSYLGTRQGAETSLRAYEFRQLDQIFRSWGTVDDGYAIVRPITAGGRLFAFATAMDNHNSGDPIFIPPFVLTAASGPSPTPTPTPTGSPTSTRTPTPTPTTPTGASPSPTPSLDTTIPPIALVATAMTSLSAVDTSKINLLDLHNTAITAGVAGVVNKIVQTYPVLQNIVHSSGDSIRVDFGSHYVATDGAVYTGSAQIDTTSHTTSGTHTQWTGHVTPSNLTKNGQAVPFGPATLSTDFTSSGSTVVGDVSLTAQNALNPSQTLATGSAHFDSSRCAKFPVSGSIQITWAGATRTVTFNDKCDGSFNYDAPLNGYYAFVGFYAPEGKDGNDCYEPPGFIPLPLFAVAFVAQDGALMADPGYTSILDPKHQYQFGGSGWFNGVAASAKFRLNYLDFDDSTPYARLDIMATFSGVRTPIPSGANPSLKDYFVGPLQVVFTTSAPYKSCKTTLVTSGILAGPCPKAHCAN